MEQPSNVQKFTIMVRDLSNVRHVCCLTCSERLFSILRWVFDDASQLQVPVSIVVALVTGIISKIIELTVLNVLISVTHASFHEGVEDVSRLPVPVCCVSLQQTHTQHTILII